MNTVDLAKLTDAELIQLLQDVFAESRRRGVEAQCAVDAVMVDESEKTAISNAAAEREAAKLRAHERERIAKEAAETVRRDAEGKQAAINVERSEADRQKREAERELAAETARKAASDALAKSDAAMARKAAWLSRFAALIETEPANLTICCLKNGASYGGGTRILVNAGGNSRYEKKHLVEYATCDNSIKAAKPLIGKKRELLGLCAELAASPIGVVCGEETIFP